MQKISSSPLLKQIWIASAMWVYQFTVGVAVAYPSSLLPALRDPNSNFNVDLNITSFIVSSIGFSNMIGFFLIGFSMDYFGRKKCILFITVPGVVGWTLIALATDVTTIIIGRVLTGVAIGTTISLTVVIITEYSSPEYRGALMNGKFSAAIFGTAFGHIVQFFATWRQIAIIVATLIALTTICLLRFPESPAWLAAKRKFEECEKSFFWLRGKSETSIKELDELIKFYKTDFKTNEESTRSFDKIVEFSKNLRSKEFYKPLIIICLSGIVFELSGRNYIVAYAMDIIDEISGDKTDYFYAMNSFDIILVLYGVTSPAIVRFLNRRTLFFVGGFLSVFVLFIFCFYLFLVSKGIIPKGSPWIPLSIFAVYFLFSNYGCCTVPYILYGELLPATSKGVSIILLGVIVSLNLQTSLLCFPYLLAFINIYETFAVIGLIMTILLVVLYFILPETKGKTLIEINNYFLYGEYYIKNLSDKESVSMRFEGVKVRH